MKAQTSGLILRILLLWVSVNTAGTVFAGPPAGSETTEDAGEHADMRRAMAMWPRLLQLQVSPSSPDVRQAAQLAERYVQELVAASLGIEMPDLLLLAATPSGEPAYAVTREQLMVLREGEWQAVSPLPGRPLALAVARGGRTLVLATDSTGLFRSTDGGEHWTHLQFGVDTPTQLTATAVAIDAGDEGRIFVALATTALDGTSMSGIGIFERNCKDDVWQWHPDAPSGEITTRLILGPAVPGVLYGQTASGTWRYEIEPSRAAFCDRAVPAQPPDPNEQRATSTHGSRDG